MGGGKTARLPWPDLARGIGIFLVALGHSALVADPVKYWIYTFHMPLFFFVSGYFMRLRENSLWKTFRRRCYVLLPTYFAYSLARWLWACREGADWKKLLGIFVNLPGGDYDGYVWFFLGLLGAEMLICVFMKLLKKPEWVLLGCCALAALVLLWREQGLPRWFWHLDGACLLAPYAGLGHLLAQKKDWWERVPARSAKGALIALGCLVLNLALCVFNGQNTTWHIDYNLLITHEVFSCYLAGLFGLGFALWVCRVLPELRFFTFVGQNSGVYYCVGWIGSNVLHRLAYLFFSPHGLCLLAVHLIGLWLVPLPLVLALNRWAPWLVGKERKVKTKA